MHRIFSYCVAIYVVLHSKKRCTFCAYLACRVIDSKLCLGITTMQAMHIIFHFPYYPVLPVVLHTKALHYVHCMSI
jgi:hypothetical protein